MPFLPVSLPVFRRDGLMASLCAGCCVLALSSVPVSALAAPGSAGGAQVRAYSIPAGALADALTRFAAENGLYLAAPAGLTSGQNSQGLRGRHSVEQGLARLLEGTGLGYRLRDGRITLHRVSASARTSTAGERQGRASRPARTAAPAPARRGAAAQPNIIVTGERAGDYSVAKTASATGLDLSVKETPQSLTVFTAQQIQDQGLLTLAEVLDQTPGITLITAGVSGAGSQPVYARTFPVTSIQMDGIMASTYILSGSANGDIGMQDSFLYERIDIIRGSNSLTGGAGDPSASLNFVRKHPGHEPALSAAMKYGSWNTMRVEVDATTPLNADGSWRVRLAGAGQSGDHWVDRVSSDRIALSLITAFEPDDENSFTVGGTYFDFTLKGASPHGVTRYSNIYDYFRENDRDYAVATAPTRANYNNATPWSRAKREYINLFGSYERKFGRDWSLKLNYNYANNKDDKLYGEIGTRYYVPELDRASYTARRDNRENEVHAFDARLKGSFSLFGRDHDFLIGANYYNVHHKIHWGYAYVNGPAAGDASLVVGRYDARDACVPGGWFYDYLAQRAADPQAVYEQDLASWEVMKQFYEDDPTMEEWWGPLAPRPTLESVTQAIQTQVSETQERCDYKSGVSISDWEANGNNFDPPVFDDGANMYDKRITTHLKSRQYGAYFAAHLRPLARTHLIVGGRWARDKQKDSYYSCYTEEHYKPYCDGTYANDGTLRRNTPPTLKPKFLPYAGLIYEVTPQINAYASYTSTYVRDINSNNTVSLATGEWLPPVRSITYEGGFKGGFFGNRLNVAAAYFQMKQKDFPFQTYDPNAPQTRDKGWEVKGWELNVSGNITRNWNIAGGYVNQKQTVPVNEGEVLLGARDDFTGSYRSPKNSVKLFTTYRLDRLQVGTSFRWQSKTESAWIPPNKTTSEQLMMKQDPYALVDLMARYSFTPTIRLQLNVNNVFDKLYYQHERSFISGAPRNFLLTLSSAW